MQKSALRKAYKKNKLSEFAVHGGNFQLAANTASVINVEHGILKKNRGKDLLELPEIGFAN